LHYKGFKGCGGAIEKLKQKTLKFWLMIKLDKIQKLSFNQTAKSMRHESMFNNTTIQQFNNSTIQQEKPNWNDQKKMVKSTKHISNYNNFV
jgi:hypothetical protein